MEKMTEQELVGLKYLEMLRLMVVVKNLEHSIWWMKLPILPMTVPSTR